MSPSLEALGGPVAVDAGAGQASIPCTSITPDASVAVREGVHSALPVWVHWLRPPRLLHHRRLEGGRSSAAGRSGRCNRLNGFNVCFRNRLLNRSVILSLRGRCEIRCVWCLEVLLLRLWGCLCPTGGGLGLLQGMMHHNNYLNKNLIRTFASLSNSISQPICCVYSKNRNFWVFIYLD